MHNIDSNVRTNYIINIEYEKRTHVLNINETIIWENRDSVKIDSLFFNIPTNIKNKGSDYSRLKYKITSFKVDEQQTDLDFIQFYKKGFIDSSLALVKLKNKILKNDSIKISIKYIIQLPEERSWSDGLFYNFENWYVTISPIFEGKIYATPTHSYIKTFLEFSNYDISISLPDILSIAVPGDFESKSINGISTTTFKIRNTLQVNWFMFNKLKKFTEQIIVGNKKIKLDLFIQKAKDKYVDRYVNGITKYLESLVKYGEYPFNRIVVVDIPNIEQVENKSYSGIVAIKTELLSPIRTQKFEYDLALVIAEQYFGNMINTNGIKESWLSLGLSAYTAEKLVRKHYGDLYSYFYIAEYYPIFGLHFMSYAGIPLIYTLSDQVIPEGARHIKKYYDNLLYADMSLPSYKLPNKGAYEVASIIKPQIALLTFEKTIGENNFRGKISKYFNNYLQKHATGKDFIKIINDGCTETKRTFSDELFLSDIVFDYAIKSINEYSEGNYEIMVERIEEGILPTTLIIYSETDTIKINWNGVERFKVFNVSSSTLIISAQIDIEGKNLLDLNIANNSYVVDAQYWGAISYATRVFFWFQNALMLIGGKG